MNRIEQLFSHMDRWRHLPAYQLERRADIFFSLYLVEVLEEVTGVPVSPSLVPEFPIKRELIGSHKSTGHSVQVDYVAFAADRSKLYMVELKTDIGSRRDKQDDYLRRAKEVGISALLEGLIEIVLVTKSTYRQKYAHLLQALADHGCLSLHAELMDFIFPKGRSGLGELLRKSRVTVGPGEFDIEVIYIQPTKEVGDDNVIDFEEFAQVVGRHEDGVSQTFADHLRRWTSKAGAARPA
ncbi:MAG: hypothetical protein ACE366_24745 [Bradymonadia bacterium]